MHQTSFGGLARPKPAGGAYSAPQAPSWIKESLLPMEGVGGRGLMKGKGGEGGEG